MLRRGGEAAAAAAATTTVEYPTQANMHIYHHLPPNSYQIATHFTPVGKPRAIWVFLAKEKSHNVSICHDHNTGRVELTLDGQLVSGRKYKILDSGIKLDFAVGVLSGSVKVTPNMFSFKYVCVCNGCVLKPCHTMKQGAIDVEPIDVTQGGATLIGGMAEEVRE